MTVKALTNQRYLIGAYNKGELERVAKDLNLYQNIESDKEWEDLEGIPMRKKSYLVKHSKGLARWVVKMKRGDVVSVSCEFQVK